MRALILGATGGLGRALAEKLAAQGYDLILVARHSLDLEALAQDLKLKYAKSIEVVQMDLMAPEALNELNRWAETGIVDLLCFCQVIADDKDDGPLSKDSIEKLLWVNHGLTVQVVQPYLGLFKSKGGTIIAFGSVAAAFGRKRNMVYASSKRALRSYFESLRHFSEGTLLKVHFYELGFMATRNAVHLDLPFQPVLPEFVAKHVVNGLKKKSSVEIYGFRWKCIVFLLKNLPYGLLKRMSF